MKKRTRKEEIEYTDFSLLKAAEGGFSRQYAMELLRSHGIRCTISGAYSPYVGHYGLRVETKYREKAAKLFWGR